MATASAARPKDYLAPEPVMLKEYEAPREPINYERLHAKAVARIDELEAELATYQGEAKLVSLAVSPIGFLVLDDRGMLFELVNDPTPRGPGPQAKMWVHRPGPKR
jgi:hypothetical protein